MNDIIKYLKRNKMKTIQKKTMTDSKFWSTIGKQNKWYNSITVKITLLAWSMLVTTIVIVSLYNYTNQKSLVIELLQNQVKNTSESIKSAYSTEIFTDEYEELSQYCNDLVKDSKSLELVVLAKKDGVVLNFGKDTWTMDESGDKWKDLNINENGDFILLPGRLTELFVSKEEFIYTGVNWGHIYIGLSLKFYKESINDLLIQTILFTVVFIIIGFFLAYNFSKALTKPIRNLLATTNKVENGDLSANADIKSRDELGILAISFNSMIDSLRKSTENLENTVKERTNLLEESNKNLIEEVVERKKAEDSLKQYTLKLETLEDIYKGIISAATSEEVFFKSVNIIKQKIIQFTMAGLSIYDKDKNSAKVINMRIQNDEVTIENKDITLDNYYGLNKRPDLPYCFQKDLTKVAIKNPYELIIYEQGIISYVSFPLHYQQSLIGELNFGFNEPLELDNYNNNLIAEISHHISIGVMQLFLEEKLKTAAEEMQASLHEKEVLLKEIHHRVKNNLQVISSMLYLQSRNTDDEKMMAVFKDSQMRVRSLAMVHEKLYQSESMSKINLADYIKSLATAIKSTYKQPGSEINIKFEMEEIFLSVDKAVSIGLITNELITNVYKYAFPSNVYDQNCEKKAIIKATKYNDSKVEIVISDNGIGVDESLNIETNKSLGLKIVTSLVSQLRGKFFIKHKNDTEFRIIIPEE